MIRGEVWTVPGSGDYAGEPRLAVIIQDTRFEALESITICAFTTDPTVAPIFRLPVAPAPQNGLREPSQLMVDKIITVPKTKMGSFLGRLSDEDLVRLNRSILVFLGLAGT